MSLPQPRLRHRAQGTATLLTQPHVIHKAVKGNAIEEAKRRFLDEFGNLKSNYEHDVNTWEEMGLKEPLLRAIWKRNYTAVKAIPRRALVPCIQGRHALIHHTQYQDDLDIVTLTVLQRIDLANKNIQAIVLSRTRAGVWMADLQSDGRFLPLPKDLFRFSRDDPAYCKRALEAGTPIPILVLPYHKILPKLRKHVLDLSHVHTLVLDQVNFAFQDSRGKSNTQDLLGLLPHCQIMMLASRMTVAVVEMAHSILKDPLCVRVSQVDRVPKGVIKDYEGEEKEKEEGDAEEENEEGAEGGQSEQAVGGEEAEEAEEEENDEIKSAWFGDKVGFMKK